MTPTTQPLSVPAQAANPVPPRHREATRLLRLWADLAQRAAEAAAHRNGDEPSLRDLQLQVEDAITDRFPELASLLDELLVWEANLIHVTEAPPETCYICRKARLQLPLSIPLPAGMGGAR